MGLMSKRELLAAALCAAAARHGWAAEPLRTLQPGELLVAYRTDDKPISFIENGVPSGMLVDLVQAIGARLGLHVSFVSTSFAAMLPAIRNERYDTAAFGVIVTPEREKIVDFTKPVGYAEARLVSRKAARIERVEDASGHTVAVTQGSALIPLLGRIAPGVSTREFPNIAASLNALLAGQVDGLFTGLATADGLVARQDTLTASQVVISGVNAFPIAKTNATLLAAMNGAIVALMNDGTFVRLFRKWNPPDVPVPEPLFRDYPDMKRL